FLFRLSIRHFAERLRVSSQQKTRRTTMNATHEIETLIDTYRQAVIAKDVEKIMALYGDDIVSYDAVKALQFRGKAAYRKHWLECMEMCQGAHKFDFDQMNVVADEHIAFAHWLAHCGGRSEER